MGQKVSPHGLRVGVIKDWDSKWYADKNRFADCLVEDNKDRENEKKKQAKRLEKQKRREERQAGGSSSLDDMIAYVDENGNITDTPPQLRPKVEIQLEDIVIATPKKEDIAAEPLKGRVEYFNTEKGYGFIKDLASTEKYFFHISSAPEGIGEGRIVLFELMRGTRGMNAVKIAFAQ